MAVAREQDVKNLAVFALDALTSIPAVPTAGVAYRDAAATEETFEAGQAYSSVYNSATYNQLFYLLSSVAKSMCEYGIMPFIAGQAYKQYARCIWTDGNVYRCSRDIAETENPYPEPNDGTQVWSREPSQLEALRKSWIGVPRPWRSTTLPTGFVWANGGLVLFEDYPELEEVYDAGGFSGMLLAYDADEETIAANLGKWRPNSANPTGLYTPSLGGQFSRAWVPGGDKNAGTWGRDTGRSLIGTIDFDVCSFVWESSGAFSSIGDTDGLNAQQGIAASHQTAVYFDTEKVWGEHSGNEFTPTHILQPAVIYLGLST